MAEIRTPKGLVVGLVAKPEELVKKPEPTVEKPGEVKHRGRPPRADK